MKKILVVNAGSSSIKWKIYLEENGQLEDFAEGLADRIFVDGHLETKFKDKKFARDILLQNHEQAVNAILEDLQTHEIVKNIKEISLIGNRVVQGGAIFPSSSKVQEKELQQIEDLSVLAPLHNPGAVKVMKVFQKLLPQAKLSATFDTSFHSSIPRVNYEYPIKKELTQELQIRKYGFHGTSHRFITEKLKNILQKEEVTFVNCHIGNGASLCAIKNSKSFDTSMGLTPLAGIMMGTRSGDIDPSIHKYVLEEKNISIQEFETILNKESGIKGVSGISQDLRDVEKAAKEGNQDAKFALELYVSKIVDYLSSYSNKLGGKLDAIVFTAGVGENSSLIRQEVINKLHFAKVTLNKEQNEDKIGEYALVSTKDSDIPVFVIRTNEELLIAKDALELNG